MTERIIRDRPLTDAQATERASLREQIEAELPVLLARRKEAPGHANLEDLDEEQQLLAFLHAERQRQGISIEEIAHRVRYKLDDVRALEEGRLSNPPLAMISRFARALGKRVILSLRPGQPWHDPRPAGHSAEKS